MLQHSPDCVKRYQISSARLSGRAMRLESRSRMRPKPGGPSSNQREIDMSGATKTSLNRRSLFAVIGGTAALAVISGKGAPSLAQQTGVLQDVMQRGTVRIAIVGGNPPYTKMNPSGDPEGYEID